MNLLAGVNHVAVLTSDLDRFVSFYSEIFDIDVLFSESTPAFRHAILRTGPSSWLHPAEVVGNTHGTALPAMFGRGHLDHIALTASSYDAFMLIRERLIARHASSGDVDDLGAFHSIWFEDPDAMRGEIVVIVDPELREIHEPRPLEANASVPSGVR